MKRSRLKYITLIQSLGSGNPEMKENKKYKQSSENGGVEPNTKKMSPRRIETHPRGFNRQHLPSNSQDKKGTKYEGSAYSAKTTDHADKCRAEGCQDGHQEHQTKRKTEKKSNKKIKMKRSLTNPSQPRNTHNIHPLCMSIPFPPDITFRR